MYDLDVTLLHMRKRGEFEMATICGRLTHEREVDVQTTFVVDEGGITDAVGLDPIADVLSKLEVTRLCAKQLV